MKTAPTESNMFTPASRQEWREWLQTNHEIYHEIWLVYYKKNTGKPSLSYDDSVEEAICFGWIDGIKKRIDDERYCHRFTPRKGNSRWSETNIRRAGEMIKEGFMTSSGMILFKGVLNKPEKINVIPEILRKPAMPGDLSRGLKEKNVYDDFMKFSESYRTMCIRWIEAAKRQDTRFRRISEVVDKTRLGEKIGLK